MLWNSPTQSEVGESRSSNSFTPLSNNFGLYQRLFMIPANTVGPHLSFLLASFAKLQMHWNVTPIPQHTTAALFNCSVMEDSKIQGEKKMWQVVCYWTTVHAELLLHMRTLRSSPIFPWKFELFFINLEGVHTLQLKSYTCWVFYNLMPVFLLYLNTVHMLIKKKVTLNIRSAIS